jgi:peptidoglycan-associated lipoprotein
MIRQLMMAFLAVAVSVSCAKKNKPDAAGAGEGGPGTDDPSAISDRDIGFDPQGSDSGKIDGLSTIYFEYDKAALSSDSKSKLSANADWIKAHPSVTVQIEGHTDERGSVEYNLALGERRAKSVQSYLRNLGIDSKRLSIMSYGEEKPKAQGSDEYAWGQNRRANFVPISQ